MTQFKNHYQTLELEAFSDGDAVKAAFRRLARQYHPDLNAGNQAAEDKFKDINEAYEVLGNPSKRVFYDESLRLLLGWATTTSPKSAAPPPKAKASAQSKAAGASQKPQPAPAPSAKKTSPKEPEPPRGSTTPISDLFDSFLKKGGSAKDESSDGVFRKPEQAKGKEKHRRGEDVVVQTSITSMEAEQGVIKTVNVQHNEICRRCSGTGKVGGVACSACHGDKINVRVKKIDVRIPAGVKQGSKVRVAREGGRGSGGAENGDLFLQIQIAYDPSLRVEGLDVYGDVPISVLDAVLGAEIDVPTMMGAVKMTVPPLTSSGRVFRLKERGVQNGQSRGDHFVTVQIVMPEALSAQERELYDALARLRAKK